MDSNMGTEPIFDQRGVCKTGRRIFCLLNDNGPPLSGGWPIDNPNRLAATAAYYRAGVRRARLHRRRFGRLKLQCLPAGDDLDGRAMGLGDFEFVGHFSVSFCLSETLLQTMQENPDR